MCCSIRWLALLWGSSNLLSTTNRLASHAWIECSSAVKDCFFRSVFNLNPVSGRRCDSAACWPDCAVYSFATSAPADSEERCTPSRIQRAAPRRAAGEQPGTDFSIQSRLCSLRASPCSKLCDGPGDGRRGMVVWGRPATSYSDIAVCQTAVMVSFITFLRKGCFKAGPSLSCRAGCLPLTLRAA